jgi:hypothetical protein
MTQLYDATEGSAPLPEQFAFITLADANRKASRAFWRGLVIGGMLVGATFIGGAALAGDAASFGGTGCQLVPIEGRAHIAEARCENVETSGQSLVEADLTAGGLTVRLVLMQAPGHQPDSFTIVPPDGFIADPQTLVLDEFTSGVVRIFQFVGA